MTLITLIISTTKTYASDERQSNYDIYYYWNKYRVETPLPYSWSGSGETTGYPNVPLFYTGFSANEAAKTSSVTGTTFNNLTSITKLGITLIGLIPLLYDSLRQVTTLIKRNIYIGVHHLKSKRKVLFYNPI
ncbi:hypothetical protein [Paenibacillus sp. OK060]|uniref:hypothetical protein n=1 Tax=Paenibacillus sp. OK060 TaxID=1881034 RepID=UPI0015A41832|nr:hypothetical protein [Paenibacillus sp. OK060]